jgi:hypothetical protein
MISSFGGCVSDSNIEVIQRYHNKLLKSMHHGTFEITTFIVISVSRRLHLSSLSSPSLMKRDLKTTSTSKRPDVLPWTISQDDSNVENRLN